MQRKRHPAETPIADGTNPFDSIPKDIFGEVFSYLNHRDAVSFASTNKQGVRFFQTKNDDLKEILKQHFPHKYHPYKYKKINWMREFTFIYQKACAEDYAGLTHEAMQLFIAVKKNDVETVRKILAENKKFTSDIWQTEDASGYPLSHWVGKSRTGKKGRQPLKDFYFEQLPVKNWHDAALANQIGYLKEELRDVQAVQAKIEATIPIAIQYGHNIIVELLSDAYRNPFNLQSMHNEFLLQAAEYDNLDAMRLFRYKKANVNAPNFQRKGATPLHVAAQNGNPETTRLLLSWHANVQEKLTYRRKTALQLAIENGHPEVVSFLLLKQATLAFAALERGAYEDSLLYDTIAKWLLNKKVLVKKEDKRKIGALLDHCSDLIETLRFEIHDVGGWHEDCKMTALHLAAMNGRFEIVRLLLEKDGDKTHLNHAHQYCREYEYSTYTPLHFAALSGHRAMVLYLMRLGAKINDKSQYHVSLTMYPFHFEFITPFFVAVKNKHFHVVIAMLEEIDALKELDLNDKNVDLDAFRHDLADYILSINDLDEQKRLLELIFTDETSPLTQFFFLRTKFFTLTPSIDDANAAVHRLHLAYQTFNETEKSPPSKCVCM